VQLDRFHIKKDITIHFGKQIAEDLMGVLAGGKKQLFLDTLESLIYDGDNGKIIGVERPFLSTTRNMKVIYWIETSD